MKHENDVNAVAEAAFSAEQAVDPSPCETEKGDDGGKKVAKSGKRTSEQAEKSGKKVSKSKGKKGETCKNSAKTPDKDAKTPHNYAKNGKKTSKTGRNTTKQGDATEKAAGSTEKATGSTEKVVRSTAKTEKKKRGEGSLSSEVGAAIAFGARRFDTAEALCEAVEDYFDAITYKERAREILGVNKIGEYIYGDPLYNVRGEEIMLLRYAEPPSVAALCLAIGVPRSTWYSWQEDERFAPIIEEALTRIDAYRRQVTIEDGKRSKGAQFLIQRSEAAAMAREQRKAERDARAAADGAAPLLSTEEKLRAIEDICKLMRGESVDLAPYTVEDDERDEE